MRALPYPAPGRLLMGGLSEAWAPGRVMLLQYDRPVLLRRPAPRSARSDEVARRGFGGGMPRWMLVS